MQVVDQQRHRPLGRDPLHQPGHRLEQAGPLQGGIPQRLRWRQVQPSEQPAEIGQAADQRGQAAGLQPGQERPERLQHRSIGQVGLQRVGGALEGHEPALAGQDEGLHSQPGLADARLAGKQQRPTRPAGGAPQRGHHPAKLLGSSHQWNTRRACHGAGPYRRRSDGRTVVGWPPAARASAASRRSTSAARPSNRSENRSPIRSLSAAARLSGGSSWTRRRPAKREPPPPPPPGRGTTEGEGAHPPVPERTSETGRLVAVRDVGVRMHCGRGACAPWRVGSARPRRRRPGARAGRGRAGHGTAACPRPGPRPRPRRRRPPL